MGSLMSLLKKSVDTKTKLQEIQKEIDTIEDSKWSTLKREKNMIGLLLFITIAFYAVGIVLFYFVYMPKSRHWHETFLFMLPLLITPFIIWSLKKAVQWYFRWSLDSQEERLRKLQKEKKEILEKVQETETFNVAKEILEKYDPKALTASIRRSDESAINRTPIMQSSSNTQLRYRGGITPTSLIQRPLGTYSTFNRMPMQTPAQNQFGPNRASFNHATPTMPTPPRMALMPRMPDPARPILPRDRGVVEKLVDYVVGDGPSNRYALICKYCHSHNGMSLKEEFEYIAFRCCYCSYFNPARKIRPNAPKLMPQSQTGRLSLTPLIDEPESDTDSTKGASTSEAETSRMRIEDVTSDTTQTSNVTAGEAERDEEEKTSEEPDSSTTLVEAKTGTSSEPNEEAASGEKDEQDAIDSISNDPDRVLM